MAKATEAGRGTFQALYRKLNTAQKQAVDAIEGPVMVVAGPGTGKTHILTLRIANILAKTDTPPDGILALTFTEAAAANMRRRLAEIVGSVGYRVRIHTFHGFCQSVIEQYPDDFPRIIGAEPITDIEKIDVLSAIITGEEWEHIRPFSNNLYYLQPIRGAISQLKRENISPEKLAAFLAREQSAFDATPDLYYERGASAGMMKAKYETTAKRLARTHEFLEVYRRYEAALAERRRYDFEDMVMEVVSALEKDKKLLLRLQEEFLYILADEHQDANASQNTLLEQLGSFHESPNLFVVGDEKQAIFRFQGATLENFMYFKKRFPDARLIALTESYRSGQPILDAAHALVSAAATAEWQPVALTSKAAVAKCGIELREFSNGAFEKAWVASEVERIVKEGVEPSEIAVLYRTNDEAHDIAAAIEAKGVPVSIESGQNALLDADIRRFLTLLHAVAHFGDDEALTAAMHLNFVEIEPLDAYKITRHARRNDCLVADVLRSQGELKKAGVEQPKTAGEFYAKLLKLSRMGGSVPYIVERLLEDSGFITYAIKSPHVVELMEKIAGFTRDVEVLAAADPDYTIRQLADHIDLLEEHRVPVRKENRNASRAGAVRLMTAHRSKGLEFVYVFIVNVADGVWGGRRERSLFSLPQGAAVGSDEDERRLLYVALTRAKQAVFVSYAKESASGTERLRSRLLEDIRPELLDPKETERFEKKAVSATSVKTRRTQRAHGPDATYLRELFVEQGLSVTALNNYLQCPWQYFYSSLLRVPISPTKEMIFGTASHAALKRFFETRARGKKGGKVQLLAWFDEAMERVALSRSQRVEVKERGHAFLDGWYDAWHASWPKETKSEYKITVELPLKNSGKGTPPSTLRLRGDLDKLEFSGSTVNVVDYKTGQPKTRNAIQGKTKSDTGDYWRQLVFYKLLLDLEGRHVMKTGELDFLQPDKSGKYHKERFDISNSDVEALKGEVARVAGEIWNLDYWDRFCDDPKCRYCGLRKLMRG